MKVTIIGGGPGGLYFALLAKKAWPRWEITAYERNRPDDTFGFGVVFSDQTLDTFKAYDLVTYERIRRRFAYWGDVDVVYKGRTLRSGGNGFCGCSRNALLAILQDRCRELGVQIRFQTEVEGLEPFADSDLVVVADGINSKIREQHRDHFQPSVDLRPNKFTWLGSTKPLDAFKYFFRETPQGIILAHCYQYEEGRSTWVIETDEATWKNFGFDTMGEAEMLPVLERVFAEELEGHPAHRQPLDLAQFPHHREQDLGQGQRGAGGRRQGHRAFLHRLGHQARHGGRDRAVRGAEGGRRVPQALARYDTARREEVEKTQHAANVSLAWFEHMQRYWGMAPEQFAFGVMSRSKQITWENLELRDPAFVRNTHRWFAAQARAQGYAIDEKNPPVPMFTPFRLRGMQLANRVVVSPMDQYSAVEGVPTDWHFVHLGSRAVGGAGLVYVEMTCPSPEARITPGCTGLWNEAQRDAFKRIVDFCHANSKAKLCMQLGHCRAQGLHAARLGAHGPSARRGQLAAAVGLAHRLLRGRVAGAARDDARRHGPGEGPVRALHACSRDEAGFDMLELHMAHGYLLASFISPLTNRRTDEYGGAIGNRMRYPAGSVPRLPRRLAGGEAHVGAHLGHRLGAGRALAARTSSR